MSESEPKETRPEKTMRQHFDLDLGLEALQAGNMAKDRAMMRRGAMKQQDGTLGTSSENPEPLDDEMNIRVGDEVNNHYHQAPEPEPEPEPAQAVQPDSMSTLGKLLFAAIFTGGGVIAGVSGASLLGAFDHPQVEVPVDTNTHKQHAVQTIVKQLD